MAWHDKAYHCVAMTFNYHVLEKYLCILNSRKKDKLGTKLLCIMLILYKKVFKFVLKPEKSIIKRSTYVIHTVLLQVDLPTNFPLLKNKETFP